MKGSPEQRRRCKSGLLELMRWKCSAAPVGGCSDGGSGVWSDAMIPLSLKTKNCFIPRVILKNNFHMMYKETADLLQTSFPFVFQNNTVANQCILFFLFYEILCD